jgi:hypothetical protein
VGLQMESASSFGGSPNTRGTSPLTRRDLGRGRIDDSGDHIFTVPFDPASCLTCGRRFMAAGGTNGLIAHYQARHGGTIVKWSCSKCGRADFVSYRSATCHVPKCAGAIATLPFACDSVGCGMSFATASGLGQHVRRMHVGVANFRTAAGLPISGRCSTWSESELLVLNDFLSTRGKCSGYSTAISRALGGSKTPRQVVERAKLWLAANDGAAAGPSSAGPSSPVDSDSSSQPGLVGPADGGSSAAPVGSPDPNALTYDGLEVGGATGAPATPCPALPLIVDTSLSSAASGLGLAGAAGVPTVPGGSFSPMSGVSLDASVAGSSAAGLSPPAVGDLSPQSAAVGPVVVGPAAGADSRPGTSPSASLASPISDSPIELVSPPSSTVVRCPPASVQLLSPQTEVLASAEPVFPRVSSVGIQVEMGPRPPPTASSPQEIPGQAILLTPIDVGGMGLVEAFTSVCDLDPSARVIQPIPGAQFILFSVDVLLRELLDGRSVSQTAVDDVVDRITAALSPGPFRPAASTSRRSRDARRRREYARTQHLFSKAPKRLAAMVVEDDFSELSTSSAGPSPPLESLKTFYSSLWGTSCPSNFTYSHHPAVETADVLRPFSAKDIASRIRRLPNRGSPGLDGVRKEDLVKRLPFVQCVLAKLFAVLLLTGYFPSCWRLNRTTFILKKGKDPSQAGSWRPITISPLFARVYSGLMEVRLRQFISLDRRQRGFVSGNGCAVNTAALHLALKAARQGVLSDLCVSVLDLEKAFDSVSHQSIFDALKARGFSEHAIRPIQSMYEGASTLLCSDASCRVDLRRGVRQGDPLSSLLFNLVIDPVFSLIQPLGERSNVPYGPLGFADDLVILSSSAASGAVDLSSSYKFFSDIGLRLNAQKCFAGRVSVTGRTPHYSDPAITLPDGGTVRGLLPDEVFKYLGVSFTLATGIVPEQQAEELMSASNRLSRLRLKPRQRLHLFSAHILPQFLHSLGLANVSRALLRRVDRHLGGVYRTQLHLHPSTTDSLLYAAKRDGGLGLPRLENQVRLSSLRARQHVVATEHPALGFFTDRFDVRTEIAHCASTFSPPVQLPLTDGSLQAAKRAMKVAERERWSALNAQGRGASSFFDSRISNVWLFHSNFLSESRFINALKLRTDTLGTRVALRREDSSRSDICRRCLSDRETLGHVLGQCVHGKSRYIGRHDEVRDLLVAELDRGAGADHAVAVEQSFSVPRDHPTYPALLRPDIVVRRGGCAYILDVSVRLEDGRSLSAAHAEKVSKYACLRSVVAEFFGVSRRAEVLPVIVGMRGALPKATLSGLRTLGINHVPFLRTVSASCLRSSLDQALWHIDL